VTCSSAQIILYLRSEDPEEGWRFAIVVVVTTAVETHMTAWGAIVGC
jgi:hypothetical protein